MKITNQEIAKRIKKAREQKGHTQQAIAKLLKKSNVSISDLERGKVQVNVIDLLKIATFLQKPIEYFIADEMNDKKSELMQVIKDSTNKTIEELSPQLGHTITLIELYDSINRATTKQERREAENRLSDYYEFVATEEDEES